MAVEFQETVAMNLKEYKATLIFQIVDLCTRLLAGTFISNKKAETTVKALFKI